MYKYKYVTIENQELIVKYLPSVDVIPDVIIELAQLRDSKFCYFNEERWFNFFKHILFERFEKPKINNLHLFQMYGAFWFNHFRVEDNCLTLIYYRFTLFTKSFYEEYLPFLKNISLIDLDKTLYVYNTYYGIKKSVKETINEIVKYKTISTTFLLERKFTKEDFADLPKKWKDKLPQLEKYLSSDVNYFKDKSFKESFFVLEKIKFYLKKYGNFFQTVLHTCKLNLDNPEEVRQKFYAELNKNCRLLCNPLTLNVSLLGKWTVVELNTNYKFIEESAVQNHCIGRSDYYMNRVKNGSIRAFSFRKVIGESEKRHTVVYARTGNTWHIEQDKSVNNYLKEKVYNNCDLKYLEVNLERVKKELEKSLRVTMEDDLI